MVFTQSALTRKCYSIGGAIPSKTVNQLCNIWFKILNLTSSADKHFSRLNTSISAGSIQTSSGEHRDTFISKYYYTTEYSSKPTPAPLATRPTNPLHPITNHPYFIKIVAPTIFRYTHPFNEYQIYLENSLWCAIVSLEVPETPD